MKSKEKNKLINKILENIMSDPEAWEEGVIEKALRRDTGRIMIKLSIAFPYTIYFSTNRHVNSVLLSFPQYLKALYCWYRFKKYNKKEQDEEKLQGLKKAVDELELSGLHTKPSR